MGIDARDIAHLQIGSSRGHGIIDLDRIAVTPANWQDWRSPFAAPPDSLTIKFPNINVFDKASCSACQSTLLLFLLHHKEQLWEYFPTQEFIDVAIGRGNDNLPAGTLCIGNCVAAHRETGIFVPGCPPVGSQILATISDEQIKNKNDSAKKPEP